MVNRALPHLPENPILNRIAHVLVASLLSVTMLGVLAIRAGADDLDDRQAASAVSAPERSAVKESAGSSVESTASSTAG